MRILFKALTILLLLVPGSPAQASKYTPDDLYRYQYVRLANGLDVFLKPRLSAHNVSIRMAVHVGTYDFACGSKETPHFLEHLLFTGTSKHSETELDSLIEDNGGSWNAETSGEKTVYQVNIHDQYAHLALNTLYEILTDSQITPESVARSRAIIHRESGGEPSSFRNWLYRQGIGRSAQDKVDELLWPAEFNCQELETANGINREKIIEAWKKYYVPNNMAIIVVGNFQPSNILAQIRKTFGQLPAAPLPPEVHGEVPVAKRQRVTGTFSPILGTEAYVSLHYQAKGYASDEVFPMILLNNLLMQEMFRELRVEKGLAYAPSSSMGFDRDVGVIILSADSGLSKIERVEKSMLEMVDRLRGKAIEPETLERIRRRVLLGYAQGYEDNDSIASHYSSLWRRFESNGKIANLEDKLNRITAPQLSRLSRQILDPSRVIIAVARPTISYHRLYTLLAIVLSLLAVSAAYYWWKKRGSRKQ